MFKNRVIENKFFFIFYLPIDLHYNNVDCVGWCSVSLIFYTIVANFYQNHQGV